MSSLDAYEQLDQYEDVTHHAVTVLAAMPADLFDRLVRDMPAARKLLDAIDVVRGREGYVEGMRERFSSTATERG